MTQTAVVGHTLEHLEGIIERGLTTFVEVGLALLEIRDSRLYREAHPTFELYCRERWSMSRGRAYQLIDAAEVVGRLSTTVDKPSSEAVARELSRLPANWQDQAWQDATGRHGPEPTAADVRDIVAPRLGVHFSSATDQWATPQQLFDKLDGEFGFDIDVCASAENAKCATFYARADNGLVQDWGNAVCWMNPPYGDEIGLWVEKAYESAKDGAKVVCLVPSRTDTAWWHDYVGHGDVRFLRGRLKFGDAQTGAPFPSCVVVFPGEGQMGNWEWR